MPPAFPDADLQQPSRFTPVLTILERADGEFRDIGLAYWEWLGMRDTSLGGDASWTSAWASSTQAIADRFGEAAGRLYLIAAASVEASLPEIGCPRCNAPVALRTRTALDDLAHGAAPEGCCGRCNPRVQQEVDKLLDPTRQSARVQKKQAAAERRAAEQVRAKQAQRVTEAAAQQVQDRRNALARHYSLTHLPWESVDFDELRANLRVEAATLALLDHAPDSSPIPASVTWETPLAPAPDLELAALIGAFRAGMINIHPGSRLDAFEWDQDDVTEPTSNFYPARTTWYVPHGPSMSLAADALRAHVRQRTRDWLTTEQGVTDVTGLVRELIVAETVRYLDHQLSVHNLPPVPEHHRPRLIEAAERLALEHSLGQGYAVAWRAGRNAAAMSKRYPQAPVANASTYALNTFESMVTEATTSPAEELRTYGTDTRNPLSAMTISLMVTILEVDPMAASVPVVEARLRADQSFPTTFALETRNLDTAKAQTADDTDDAAYLNARAHSPTTLNGYLADALGRVEDASLDIALVDQFLISGPDPIVKGYDADEAGRNTIADGLDRLTALRATLAGLPDVEVVRCLLSLAFLMPGTVTTRHDALMPLGQVMGYDLLWAIGLGGDF